MKILEVMNLPQPPVVVDLETIGKIRSGNRKPNLTAEECVVLHMKALALDPLDYGKVMRCSDASVWYAERTAPPRPVEASSQPSPEPPPLAPVRTGREDNKPMKKKLFSKKAAKKTKKKTKK